MCIAAPEELTEEIVNPALVFLRNTQMKLIQQIEFYVDLIAGAMQDIVTIKLLADLDPWA